MQYDIIFHEANNFPQKIKYVQELKHRRIFKTSVSKYFLSSYPVIRVIVLRQSRRIVKWAVQLRFFGKTFSARAVIFYVL